MKMIPPTYPQGSPSDSKAEKKLFKWLKDCDIKGTCFHSLRLRSHHERKTGEADFVILTTNGVLVIEVKGGEVSRGKDGVWRTRGAAGTTKLSISPFVQAEQAMHALRGILTEDTEPDLIAGTAFGWAVSFPDCSAPNIRSTEWEGWQVHDHNYRNNNRLKKWIRSCQKNTMEKFHKREISRNDFEILETAIRREFSSVITLTAISENIQESIDTWTEDQLKGIRVAESHDRIVYTGGAGTGKTVIALEIARMHAADGKNVVFISPSASLANYLKSQPETEEIKIIVQRERNNDESFADFIIVDEAQDLLDMEGLDLISTWLEDGIEQGKWRFLYDENNQAGIYGRFDETASDFLKESADLSYKFETNCRNTKSIVDSVRFLLGADVGTPTVKEGNIPEIVYTDSPEDAAAKLEKRISNLLHNNIPERDIVILSSQPNSSCIDLPPFGRLRESIVRFTPEMAANNSPERNRIAFATPEEFKGLECPFVHVIDINEFHEDEKSSSSLYVSMTRAKVELWMAVSSDLEMTIENSMDKNRAAMEGSE